ncbi:MAG: NADH-quinone oxidoreductase subunit J [Sandaracinaceae bacterium]
MSAGGELVFLFCGIAALVTAVLTVSVRTPLRAAVALLGHIVSLAGLYLTLHAHLLAAIQLLVYAGAVVVLFIFVIMLIGPSAAPQTKPKWLTLRTGVAAVMGMIGASVAFGVATIDATYVDVDQCRDGAAECGQFGGVEALSDALFKGAAVPFELASILLLVAIIAAVAVARGHTPTEKRAFAAHAKDKLAEGEKLEAAAREGSA